MKKIIILVLILSLALFAACEKSGSASPSDVQASVDPTSGDSSDKTEEASPSVDGAGDDAQDPGESKEPQNTETPKEPDAPAQPEHQHLYTSVKKEPTCTERGSETFTCNCGHSFTTGTNALNHSEPAEWETEAEATCEAEGKKVKKCTRCGEILKSENIPVLTHKYEKGICSLCGGKDPSYTEPGENTTPEIPIKPDKPGGSGLIDGGWSPIF